MVFLHAVSSMNNKRFEIGQVPHPENALSVRK